MMLKRAVGALGLMLFMCGLALPSAWAIPGWGKRQKTITPYPWVCPRTPRQYAERAEHFRLAAERNAALFRFIELFGQLEKKQEKKTPPEPVGGRR